MTLSPSLQRNPQLDSWLEILGEGRVAVFTGKVELGQGIRTAIALIAAEELDVALERIEVRSADTARSPNELFTAGSGSLEESGNAVRQAAAEARAHLLELSSQQLGVPVEELRVDDGCVTAGSAAGRRGRSISYWELMAGKRFQREITGAASPKDPRHYTLVGRPTRRIGLEDLVTGRARFVQDLRPAGLAYGRVVRPPSPAARLESVDEAAARRLPGVIQIVRDGSYLAVVAEREEQAIEAVAALSRDAQWSERDSLPIQEELFDLLTRNPATSLPVVDGVPREEPVPPVETPAAAVTTLRARYLRPYHMHASIGPSAALARLDEGELTVWSHSQGVFILRASLARALELDSDRIRVIHVEGPGCYGHNGADDAALDACLLARALPGRPVLVQWERQEEHAWEPYGPAMAVDIQASLDAEGRVIDWNHDVYSDTHMGRALPFPSGSGFLADWYRDPPRMPPPRRPMLAFHGGIHRNADPLYAFPRRRIVKHLVADMPLRVSSTRGLGAFANVFAIESCMDELALEAGLDPLEFRLRHLEDERARTVLEAAAERAGWPAMRSGNGRGRGLAFARYKNQKCFAAVVIELEVSDDLRIGLRRAVIAADAGQIVDPDGLSNQLEGGLIQSASWTLAEEVRFDLRRITSVDWESYPILTFSHIPEIETVLIDQPGLPFLGSGEATQGPTPAAIANAIFDATGARLRQIPLTRERLSDALTSL